MAYNQDWDRGKDSWNANNYDNNAWNNTGVNVRSRDDESYNEVKRRKFNNGVRLLLLSVVQSLTFA